MSEQLYDPIRKEWVAETPEERVRQDLIKVMTETLGYPRDLIAVEKGLRQMPHLQDLSGVPLRRADIVCFAKGIHPEHELYPLLMIECKAVSLNKAVLHQVLGYNHFLGAYFVAIANEKEIETAWRSGEDYETRRGLPSYHQLIRSISNHSNR